MAPADLSFRRALVTGGAGFIGSSLVDRLLCGGIEVIGYDNFSTGMPEFLAPAREYPGFTLFEADVRDTESLTASMQGCDVVFHFAANADIRFGLQHPRKDLEQNTIATFNVLEAMRANDIRSIVFLSTGPIYGKTNVFPTPEDAPFPIQTSLYGASKLACEGLISAYCEGYEMQSWIFRIVSILGERYTHGHVFDFVKQLRTDPKRLRVLGDGCQRKSYLYVQDCLDAILIATKLAPDRVNIFNLGAENYCELKDSVAWISERLGLSPKITYTGGDRGWIGDNPTVFLDTKRIRDLGWREKLSIRQGIEKTVDWLVQNPWIIDRRL
jgi:UDP-glucose 4-epimerase